MKRTQGIRCRNCGHAYTPEELIAHLTVAWPNQSWAWLKCPSCSGGSHVHITNGTIQTGTLDGAPGPCFLEDQTIGVKGLTVGANPAGITITLNNKKTTIPAKQ